MTKENIDKLIGTTRLFNVGTGSIQIRVKVIRAVWSFGRIDIEIEPEQGSGTAKVRLDSTEEIKEEVHVS